MKSSFILICAFVLFSCGRNSEIEQLKAELDSLKQNSYKPGFGEFMSYIQVHHSKLWFAGQAGNWPLADFELKEISETIDNVQKYEKERKESEMVIMLKPNLDSVNTSIQNKDLGVFSSSFTAMTNKCNYCHKLVNYGFNVVQIPQTPPFSNQVFKIEEQKKQQ